MRTTKEQTAYVAQLRTVEVNTNHRPRNVASRLTRKRALRAETTNGIRHEGWRY